MTTINEREHSNDNVYQDTVASKEPQLPTAITTLSDWERKVAALESDEESLLPTVQIGKTSKALDIVPDYVLDSSFYQLPRVEIQATASISELSPSLTEPPQVLALAPPAPTSLVAQPQHIRVTEGKSTPVDQGLGPTELAISSRRATAPVEAVEALVDGPTEPALNQRCEREKGEMERDRGTPMALTGQQRGGRAQAHHDSVTPSMLSPVQQQQLQEQQQATIDPPSLPLATSVAEAAGSNRAQVQYREGRSVSSSHPPVQASLASSLPPLPPTAKTVTADRGDGRLAWVAPSVPLAEPAAGTSSHNRNTSKTPSHTSPSSSVSRRPPSTISARSSLVSTAGTLVNELQRTPSSSSTTQVGGRSRRPSASSSVSPSVHRHQPSLPTRPQPAHCMTPHTFVAMRPLNRPARRDFDQASILSTTSTMVPTTTAPSAAATATAVVPINANPPWNEQEFKQVYRSMSSLLEEYEELSDRILESLILATNHAADMYASGPELGYGDCSAGKDNDSDFEFTVPFPGTESSSISSNKNKGKGKQDSGSVLGAPLQSSPSPSTYKYKDSDTTLQDDLDKIPFHLYDGRPWPRGLHQRQRLARRLTVLIASYWPKLHASYPDAQLTSKIFKQRERAKVKIKDAVSTLWSLQSGFQEKSAVVLDILRDRDELCGGNIQLLRSRHLNFLMDAPDLTPSQIDSLDQLVKADYDRLQFLTEPLEHIWLLQLMLESNTAKASTGNGSHSRTLRGSLSALFPATSSAMTSAASMTQHDGGAEQTTSVSSGRRIWNLGRNSRFTFKNLIKRR